MVFLVYLGVAIWGCTMVREGLERRRLSKDDSYSVQFYDVEDQYFREHPYRVQVGLSISPRHRGRLWSHTNHVTTSGAAGVPNTVPSPVCVKNSTPFVIVNMRLLKYIA